MRFLQKCQESAILIQCVVRMWQAKTKRVVRRTLKELETGKFEDLGFQKDKKKDTGLGLATPDEAHLVPADDTDEATSSFELPWLDTSGGWGDSNVQSRREYSKNPADLESWYERNKGEMHRGKLVAGSHPEDAHTK
jgi:hypothetical protein